MQSFKLCTYLLVGLLAFSVFLVTLLPAEWVAKRSPDLRMLMEQENLELSGTLWRGKGEYRSISPSLTFRWKLSPACLLLLKGCVQMDGKMTGELGKESILSLDLAVPLIPPNSGFCFPWAKLKLTDLNGVFYSSHLQQLFQRLRVSVKWAGVMQFKNVNLEVDFTTWETHNAEGSLDWVGGQFEVKPGARWQTFDLPALSLGLSQLDKAFSMNLVQANKRVQAVKAPSLMTVSVNAVKNKGMAELKIFKGFGVLLKQMPSSVNQNEVFYEETLAIEEMVCVQQK